MRNRPAQPDDRAVDIVLPLAIGTCLGAAVSSVSTGAWAVMAWQLIAAAAFAFARHQARQVSDMIARRQNRERLRAIQEDLNDKPEEP